MTNQKLLIKDYIIKFIPSLKLKIEIRLELEQRSLKIYEEIKDLNLINGKNPRGMAGSIIYLSAMIIGNKITQEEIADISGVTTFTIRRRYEEIMDYIDIHP